LTDLGEAPVELQVIRGWCVDPDPLLTAVRETFTYGSGEDRATGYLHGDRDWPPPLAALGPELLDDLAARCGVQFTVVAFQAYLDGAGCGWHTDSPFDVQAVLSLGVTRTFGIRRPGGEPQWVKVAHGDLVVMPSGFQRQWEHCVPVEDVPGERVSLVFRTVVRS
jgi:alkylated DNA repair dioxygenase AlkB